LASQAIVAEGRVYRSHGRRDSSMNGIV
jgi:hypothetical protein